jgi:hypothetical protein
VDNTEIDLREIGRGGMDWIDLALDMDQWRALVNTPWGSIKCWDVLEQLHVWRLLKKLVIPITSTANAVCTVLRDVQAFHISCTIF